MLSLSRTSLADLVGPHGKALIAEADAVHRRFLFALGLALASLLLGLEALARLFNAALCGLGWVLPEKWDFELPAIHSLLLAALAAIGLATSFLLRWVASRWWESKLTLTSILLRIQNTPPSG